MTELIPREKIAGWQKLKTLVLDSVSSPITKRVYNMALDEFMVWYQQEPRPGFTKATVSAWRASLEARKLGSSSIIIRMSAIRKLAAEAADNGLLAPELAAGITRVKSAKSVGIRTISGSNVPSTPVADAQGRKPFLLRRTSQAPAPRARHLGNRLLAGAPGRRRLDGEKPCGPARSQSRVGYAASHHLLNISSARRLRQSSRRHRLRSRFHRSSPRPARCGGSRHHQRGPAHRRR